MKVIIGLGNPGRKYERTRHNAGFFVTEELSRRYKVKLDKTKFKANYAIEHIGGEKVLIVEPQTYMNLSGEAVRPLLDFYQIDVDDILVVYDDLDLPVGKIRLRQKGGHGGHNGIRSLIDHLGTQEFKRIRLGIGRPETAQPIVDYVLRPFDREQEADLQLAVLEAADAAEAWFKSDFIEVMNKYN